MSKYPADLYAGCPCFKCDQPVEELALGGGKTIQVLRRMSLCPECGSKRCPGAMDHNNHQGEHEMTDQPYTPTKGDLKKAWDWYRANQDKQSGIEQNFRTYRFEFLRAWDAIESAAEQRGAVKALLEAAESKSLIDYMYTNLHVNQPAVVREAAKYLHNRADLLEGDDETH